MTATIDAPPPGWTTQAGRLSSIRRGVGPRLVFVHGFTQIAQSWLPVAEQFVDEYEVILVDAPGHGGSHDVRADLRLGADLLVGLGGHATYIGYSLGGRLCLHAAVGYPNAVRRLILLGTSPGILDDQQRADRRVADERLAQEIEQGGVESFVDKWLEQPLFASLPKAFARRDERLSNTVEGLASSLRLAGTGVQLALWDRLSQISAASLILAGENDTKFAALGRQMAEEMKNAAFAKIEGAGHAAHLEQPGLTTIAIRKWLDGTRYLGS
jgi:2-succinyl-6-hydroxy-2,4-cyclohexadiene-1-carboxylate synthase